jgi:O-antigen/teichoic acid export membrane protein
LFSSQVIALAAMFITIPFIVAGGWAVDILYGHKYAAAAGFIGWLGAMWGIRIIRVAPTVAAIARGDTQNAMYSNVARSLAFVGMLLVAALGGRLAWISICGFLGELLAFTASLWRLRVRQSVPVSICLKPFLVFSGGMAVAAFLAALKLASSGPLVLIPVTLAIVGATVVAMFTVFPNLRSDISLLFEKKQPVSAASEEETALIHGA